MYEFFRSDFINELQLPEAQIRDIIRALDKVSSRYEIVKKTDPEALTDDGIIDVYCRSLELSGRSKKTTKLYRFYLEKLHKFIGRELITARKNDLQRFIYYYQFEREEKLSSKTASLMLTIIKSFYLWLTDEEYIEKDPARAIKPIKCEKIIKDPLDEFSMEKVRRSDLSIRDKALVEVAFSTGCRINELRTMELKNYDKVNHRIKVMGKGSKERYVLLNVASTLALDEYLASRCDDSPFVFVSERKPNKQLTESGILAVFRRIKQEHNLQDFSCHKIRHTTASIMLNKGADVSVVQRVLGHSNINTTMLYAVNSDERIQHEHWRCIV